MTRPRWILRLLSPLCVLMVWGLASSNRDPQFAAVPGTSQAFVDLWVLITSGYLAKAVYASLFRVVCGFAIAVVAGVALGASMARIRLAGDLLDPLVELLRPISPLALYPLAILWFGIGGTRRRSLSSRWQPRSRSSSTLLLVSEISMPICSAPRARWVRANSRSSGVSCCPAACLTFTGVRLAWGISLIVIIAAEMVGATEGIGYMVLEAQQTFRTERVFAGIFVIGLIGFATNLGFRHLRRVLIHGLERPRAETASEPAQ